MKRNILVWGLFLVSMVICAQNMEKQKINEVLDGWHLAAANADFEAYFENMT